MLSAARKGACCGPTQVKKLAVVGLVAALALTGASVRADYAVNYDKANTSRWACRLCEFHRNTSRGGRIRVGGIHSAKGEARFGRANGIDRAGDYGRFDANYRATAPTGAIFRLDARNLGLAAHDLTLEIAQAGRYGVRVRRQASPWNVAADGRSPFAQVGERLTLPSAWPAAFTTAEMSELSVASQAIDLASERVKTEAELWLAITPKLKLQTSYFKERKTGLVAAFRDAFYQATALPKPIDHRTAGVQASLRYQGTIAAFGASYRSTRFANGNDALAWHNPYIGGPATLQAGVAPDNRLNALTLTSRLKLGPRTLFNANITKGETRQNAPFLPYTTNTAIATAPLPATDLNGRRTAQRGTVNLVSALTSRWRLTASYTASRRRDRREEIFLVPVLGDLFVTPEIMASGYSFSRKRAALRLRYQAPYGVRLAAGVSRLVTKRTNLEILTNNEDEVWFEAMRDFSENWQLSVRRTGSSRDASPFRANTANNPLTRRFHQAQRDAAAWRAALRYHSQATGFTGGLAFEALRYDYPDAVLGLRRDSARGWHADLGYRAGGVSASAFYDVQRNSAETAGSSVFAAPNWHYDTSDVVKSAGMRVAAEGTLHHAVDLWLEYAYSNGLGRYATTLESAQTSFPALVSRHESLNAQLRYRLRRGWAITARVYAERYRGADWAVDGIAQNSIRNVLTFGLTSPRYSNRLLALGVEKAL